MATDYCRREDVEKTLFRRLNPSLLAESFIEAVVNEIPTADAVEVVRCRDCVDCIDGFVCKNGQFRGRTFPNNFCSDGERRGDDGEG